MKILRELPCLDTVRCTGCGACVAICPTRCLEMQRTQPWLPRPLQCVSCAACVVICEPEALRLVEDPG